MSNGGNHAKDLLKARDKYGLDTWLFEIERHGAADSASGLRHTTIGCTLAPSGKACHRMPGGNLLTMPDEILTLPEVAQLLKVADKTVYTMAQKGEIPAFKVRGQWRFKRADIDRWIEERKSASRADHDEGEPRS
jgi:excisionase family DNA binding protein